MPGGARDRDVLVVSVEHEVEGGGEGWRTVNVVIRGRVVTRGGHEVLYAPRFLGYVKALKVEAGGARVAWTNQQVRGGPLPPQRRDPKRGVEKGKRLFVLHVHASAALR